MEGFDFNGPSSNSTDQIKNEFLPQCMMKNNTQPYFYLIFPLVVLMVLVPTWHLFSFQFGWTF